MKKHKFVKIKSDFDSNKAISYRLNGLRTGIPSLTFFVLDRLDTIQNFKQISRGYQTVMSILEPDEF